MEVKRTTADVGAEMEQKRLTVLITRHTLTIKLPKLELQKSIEEAGAL